MVGWIKAARPLSAAAFLVVSSQTTADPWLPPGDLSLRHDIELLADAEVIRSPITTWPLSWPDIARDLSRDEIREPLEPEIEAAFRRVQQAARKASRAGFATRTVAVSASEKPTALRTFNDTPREDTTASLSGSYLGDRWAARLNATAVENPDDGQKFRLDGSYLGLTLGNFMVSAGSMDRWWGPGWEGSLILSTNARPIPSLSIERNFADSPSFAWLRWIGPWRAVATLGRLDGSDVARPDARFFSARVNFKPRRWLEFGLSRTAQWCGKERPCGLDTFGDLWIGNDNRSGSLTESEEPGNQMAGYDLRIRSPWRRAPFALYTQLIGEDEAGGLPSRLIGQFGVETWGALPVGTYRLHAEYTDTASNFSRQSPLFDYTYRNSLYPQGYTYRGRTIGHALDNDGRMLALGAIWVRPNGDSWNLLVRKAEINRDDVTEADVNHPLSATRDPVRNLELQYNRAFIWGELGLGIGLDDHTAPVGGRDVRALVQWRQGF